MTSMIYVDPDFGPSARGAVRCGARRRWMARTIPRGASRGAVRSRDPAFRDARPRVVGPVPARTSATIDHNPRAAGRQYRARLAAARARRGEGSVAGKETAATALRSGCWSRAIRLLEARGAHDGRRGLCAAAGVDLCEVEATPATPTAQVARARGVSSDSQRCRRIQRRCRGVLWTDEGRFVEAEAALRSAHVAAAASSAVTKSGGARGARPRAGALVAGAPPGSAGDAGRTEWPTTCPELPAKRSRLASRIHAAGGDVASRARRRQPGAAASNAACTTVVSRRQRTVPWPSACLLARDVAGAELHARSALQRGLGRAPSAHGPATARAPVAAPCVRRILRDCPFDVFITRCRNPWAVGRLPHTVRVQITRRAKRIPPDRSAIGSIDSVAMAARSSPNSSMRRSGRRTMPAAVASVLGMVFDRIQAASGAVSCRRRRLANDRRGRTAVARAVVQRARARSHSGLSVAIDRALQPPEAAEPIKYAGNTVAAIACRWPAGSPVDPGAVALYLGASALALSAHVQALLDVRPVLPHSAWGDLLGDSPPAVSLREAVQRAARAPFPVLIEGESGSGKELVARAIHRLGPRRDRRFCAINCAAITDELVEAELFGHARGAFTGAATERAGLFEDADGGSLFLDEVGELSARAQAKLLRVLQDGEVRRVGENFARRVDVRLIAATNRGLEQEVAASRFRADLRYPPRRRSDHRPGAARPRRGYSASRRALLARCVGPRRLTGHAGPRNARGAVTLRLAGERPRAAERHRGDRGARTSSRPDRRVAAAVPAGCRRGAVERLVRSRARGLRAPVRACGARTDRRPSRTDRKDARRIASGTGEDAAPIGN